MSQHLILLGLLDHQKLTDSIKRHPLQIEIHDRDYRYSKIERNVNQDLMESGIIQENLNPHNPYGIAKFGTF